MHLTFVLGTAAELIKLYPVARMATESGHHVHYLATGQSRENFQMQFRDFSLPENELSWLVSGAGDLEKSSSAVKWFARALLNVLVGRGHRHKTDYVIVHGDTLSTFVGALYGRRNGIPVVHVEAGLRSSQLLNPFPEEITRRLVSRLVKYHMAPDDLATGNLRAARGRVINTGGNTLLDAVRLAGGESQQPPTRPYAVVNIHRYENLNSAVRWQAIVDTLVQASQKIRLVIVMHPQTRHQLQKDADASQRLKAAGCELRERMPFSAFIGLLKGAEYLISDGGSNQEECSYLGKPCLLLRLSTERKEGLDTCCLLSRFEPGLIAKFLANPRAYQAPPFAPANSPSRLILSELGQP